MDRQKLIWSTVALFLLAALVHLPALRAGFIWDDDDYILAIDTLTDAQGLSRIWFEPGAIVQYYPMVFTTYWIEHRIWGLQPFGYHLVNILLHGLVACLCWLTLRRLNAPGAWLIAAVFAVHPIQVESVAWITERKNVLSGFFYFLSLLLFLGFDSREQRKHQRRQCWTMYGLSLFFYLCALWSKTATCTLPAVLFLLLWWKHGSIGKRTLGLLTPLFLLGLGFGLFTIWMERHHVGAQGTEWSLGLLDRILIAGRALWFYAGKLIAPNDLAFIYSRWRIESSNLWLILYPLSFVVMLVVLWRFRSGFGKGPLVAVLFFAGTLSPTLGFVDFYLMRYSFVADHFQYLAGIGWIALIIGLATVGVRRLGSFRLPISWAGSLVLIGILGLLSWKRSVVFQEPESLWIDTLSKNPTCWMAHHNLAMIYEDRGNIYDSIKHYRRAIELRPDLSQSYFNLGTLLARQGDWEQARLQFERAIVCEPDYPDAHMHLGNVLFRQRNVHGAIDEYQDALRIDPINAAAHKNLAYALSEIGQRAEAVRHYRDALRVQTDDIQTMDRLAWLLATSLDEGIRDGDEALQLALQVCRLSGFSHVPYLVTLAAAYAEAGEFDQAVAVIGRAIEESRRMGRVDAMRELEGHLRFYQAGQPLRVN